MCDLSPDPCDCQTRSLPDVQPGRTILPSSNLVASETTSSKAAYSSPSSPSGGSNSSTEPSPGVIGPGYAASVSPSRRTQLTRVACEACRRRRTKCSGDRPRCAACVRDCSECTYQSLSFVETVSQALKRRLKEMEKENNDFKALYKYLHTGSESQAHEIVRRIRMGADVGSVVRQIQDGDLLLQISLIPKERLGFELTHRTEMSAAKV